MGAFQNFSNEILHEIVIYLVDDRSKEDYFDPVRNKNLPTARLLCSSMSRVAAPFIFENMVLDEKFCKDEDINRLLIFANENPTLAGFVRRLERKVVPCVGQWSTEFQACIPYELTSDGTIEPPADSDICNERAAAYLTPRRDSHPDGSEGQASLEDSVIGRCLVPKYCLEKQKALVATLKALPNLRHLESVASVWYWTHVYEKTRRFGAGNDHEKAVIKKTNEIYPDYQNLDFDHDIRYHLSGYVTSRIFSIRLLPQTIAGVAPVWSQHLQHLRHLHLECSVQPRFDKHTMTFANRLQSAQSWNTGFERLKNLRTLKLSGGGVISTYHALAVRPILMRNFGRFLLDDLLGDCCFPHLRSLMLTDWLVSEAGVTHLIHRHSEVLQSVTLERLSLFYTRPAIGHGWLRVAKAFGSCGKLFDICLQDLKCLFIKPNSPIEMRLGDIEAMYQEIRQNRSR